MVLVELLQERLVTGFGEETLLVQQSQHSHGLEERRRKISCKEGEE